MKDNIPKSLLDEARLYSIENNHQESCGIFTYDIENKEINKFIPLENLSPNPEKTFIINPAYLMLDNLYCIFHSHLNISEKPTRSDKENCLILGVPFLIYSLRTDCFYFHEISV